MANETATLAGYVADLKFADIPPQVLERAKVLTLDFLGSAIRARSEAESTPSLLKMLEARGFRNLRAWTHGVDTEAFPFRPQPIALPAFAKLQRPIALFVGRVSYEKNIAAFLDLKLPGSLGDWLAKQSNPRTVSTISPHDAARL